MRVQVLTIGVLFCAVTLCADDRSIMFDKNVDFSTLKTFAVHDLRINSIRPEVKNALFATQVTDAIRKALTAKGLRETADRPDLVVDSSVLTGPAGRSPLAPGRPDRSLAPGPYTDGTLVIDLTAGDPGKLVWHGVYRRPRESAAKLAQKLPDDVKKLLSDYPPKKK